MTLAAILILTAAFPLLAALPMLHETTRSRAQADFAAAENAEAISKSVDRIDWLENELTELRTECISALGTAGAQVALRLRAEIILRSQSGLFTQLAGGLATLSKTGTTIYFAPRRTPSLGCGIPGPLIWRTQPEFLVRHQNLVAGFEVFRFSTLSQVRWAYRHPQVRPL